MIRNVFHRIILLSLLLGVLPFGGIELKARKKIYISNLNLPHNLETDVSKELNALFASLAGKNFEVIFDCDYDYPIGSDSHYATIYVGSNTKIKFTGKGFLKLRSPSENGALLLISNCRNVELENVQIDGGGTNIIRGNSGPNGIGISSSTNILIKGGVIRNCAKGKDVIVNNSFLLGDGGKGIQVENHGVRNCVIDGVSILNCNKAISCHRDLSQSGSIDVVFKNINAKNCGQFAIVHQTNGEDLNGTEQKVTIKNFISENCGEEDGVFIFSRTRFLKIKSGIVKGDIKVPAIFRGRIGKSEISNVTIDQPCISVVNMNPSDYGRDERETNNNTYSITVFSKYDYLISSDTNKKYPYREMINSSFRCKTKEHPAVVLYTDQVLNSGSNRIRVIFEDGERFAKK